MMRVLMTMMLAVVAMSCGRPTPGLTGTNRGELKIVVADGGAEFEIAHGYGDVKTGEEALLNFEVTNTGVDTLDIKVVKVMTEDTGAFFVRGGMGSVAPDAKRTFTVTFAPVRAGAHTGNLVFETNAEAQAARISLTGTALP